MKKVLKPVLFCSLLLYSFFILAQSTREGYLNAESARIKQAQITEIAIQNFITDNLPKYTLSAKAIAATNNNRESGIARSQADIRAAILTAKKTELRKVYFEQHPEILRFYEATSPSKALMETCVNGDFENPIVPANNYTFNSLANPPQMSACNTPALQNSPVIPVVNNVGSMVSVMSTTSPGYVQFDPSLNTANRGNIQIPTVSPNGGTQSIKLNATDGGGDHVTSMSRVLLITNPTVEYEFSLLLQDGGAGHTINQRPFFRVNIIVGGVVRFTRCINAAPNCVFNLSHGQNDSPDKDIYYTGWVCDRIDVSQFLNQQITLEFTVGDCGLVNGSHFGTVYIDNICNYVCNSPVFGFLQINALNTDCNSVNPGPYQVCGSFTPPINGTVTNLTISVSKNGGASQQISNPTFQITGTNFCFSLNPSVFGTITNGDTYQFQVTANYVQNCNTINATSFNTGYATVTFDCCPPTVTLVSTTDDMDNNAALTIKHRSAQDWIRASNIINVGNSNFQDGVVYHAGNFVELNTGFEAKLGSQFAAYPEGCTTSYVYRPQNNASSDTTNNLVRLDVSETLNRVVMYPNPANNLIEILMKKAKFKRVIIRTIDGRKLYEKSLEGEYKEQIDISKYANGIYIVNIISNDGESFLKKLIKN